MARLSDVCPEGGFDKVFATGFLTFFQLGFMRVVVISQASVLQLNYSGVWGLR
jgi:hypothetical protein